MAVAVAEAVAVGVDEDAEAGFWGERTRTSRRFRRFLLLIALAALALRVGYAFAIAGDPLAGDAGRYSAVGQAISDGRGFADPFVFDRTIPVAEHPPAASVVLSVAPLIVGYDAMYRGMTAFVFGQRLTFALVGALTVVVLGFVGRRVVAGAHPTVESRERAERAGLVVAALAAVNPNLWINDGILMSESLAALGMGVLLLAAYRAWDHPSWRTWGVLGAACGLSALIRSESVTLTAVMVAPMIVLRHRRAVGELVRHAAAAATAFVAVVAVWVVPNLLRFDHPVVFSTNDGLTLLGANCPDTYRGPLTGLWSIECIRFADADRNGTDDWTDLLGLEFGEAPPDASRASGVYRSVAVRYVREHTGDLPRVAAVRLGRVWGVYRPGEMVDYNVGEGRRPLLSWLAWGAHLLLVLPAAWGLRLLRREGRPVWPLVSQAVCVTITAVAVYGLVRFRIGWDVAATVAAGVAFASLFDARFVLRGAGSGPHGAEQNGNDGMFMQSSA